MHHQGHRIQDVFRFAGLLLAIVVLGGCGTAHALWAQTAFPREGKCFTYDGLKIHYVIGGQPAPQTRPSDSASGGAPGSGADRPTIIYVHGDFGSTRDLTMSPLWPVLCARYRVVAFDRPGYGYSPRPHGMSMSSPQHAEILHEVVRRLGGNKPIIVGHSRGARIALDYACKYIDEIGGLVLLGLPPELPNQNPQDKRPIEYSLAAMPLVGDLYVQTFVAPVGSWAGLGRRYLGEAFKPHAAGGRLEDLPPDYARACVALALRPGEFRANELDADRAYAPVGRFVADIHVPVYVVHGYLDNVCSWLAPAIMHCEGWFADSHMTLIGDGAHQPHWTHPDLVAKVIDRAVNGVGPLGVLEAAITAARQRTQKLDGSARTFVRVQNIDYVNCAGLGSQPEPPWTP